MLSDWARAWGVPQAAVADLQARLAAATLPEPVEAPARSEAAVQAAVRVEASRKGMRVWRNNVGCLRDDKGNYVRFGLANDSAQMNSAVKSGDLVGVRPLIVQPSDVGRLIGQFVSLEVKHAGWKYTGSEREVAQKRWADLVISLGGEARFVNHESQV